MQFSIDINTEISRVFKDPSQKQIDRRRSFLFLLRRDLADLYGPENSAPDRTTLKAPLLVCLGMMEGLELLAKLWTGNHEVGYADIQTFLQIAAGLDERNAIALVQFRHSAGHGYRLSATRWKGGERFNFTLDDEVTDAGPITETKRSHFTINLWALKKLFLDTVKTYRSQVKSNFELQQKFIVCLANLGECEVH